jgi:hypothetical protein
MSLTPFISWTCCISITKTNWLIWGNHRFSKNHIKSQTLIWGKFIVLLMLKPVLHSDTTEFWRIKQWLWMESQMEFVQGKMTSCENGEENDVDHFNAGGTHVSLLQFPISLHGTLQSSPYHFETTWRQYAFAKRLHRLQDNSDLPFRYLHMGTITITGTFTRLRKSWITLLASGFDRRILAQRPVTSQITSTIPALQPVTQ